MRIAWILSFVCLPACATSIPDAPTYEQQAIDANVAPDSAARDTAASLLDTSSSPSAMDASATSADTSEPPDFGATPIEDSGSGFPDFGGPSGTDAFPGFPEGGLGTCTMDGECAKPFNCCDPTKMKCGVKIGPVCTTF